METVCDNKHGAKKLTSQKAKKPRVICRVSFVFGCFSLGWVFGFLWCEDSWLLVADNIARRPSSKEGK